MKLLPFQQKTETGFDYESFGLAEIKKEADFAAISARRALDQLESALKTLILEDAPRIIKLQETMEGKRHPKTRRTCWSVWLEEVFPAGKSTLYNALQIYRELKKEAGKLDEATIDRLLQWSGRALLAALGATGDNREAAIQELAKLEPKEVTEKLVKTNFKPITKDEEEEILAQVDYYANVEELGLEDAQKLRFRAKSLANEYAANQNKKVPSVTDFQRAAEIVTKKQIEPPSGARTRTTSKQYQELLETARQKDEVINQQKNELAEAYAAIRQLEKDRSELSDRVKQLEQRLQKAGVAA